MTTDLRALITQMAAKLDHCEQLLLDDRRQRHPLAARARALLAEADGPAVPDDREPASAALQPSDDDLWTMYDEMRGEPGDWAWVRDFARAALDRWGRPDYRALLDQPMALSDIGQEWRPCVKLPITVHVRDQRPGETHSSTREGITPLRSDDLIMRGVQGEEYPIGRDLFEQTYELLPTPEATND